MSSLFPRVRHDVRFLSSFFLIRILFNAVLLIDCLRPSSRMVTDRSWVPSTMLFLAGCLHVSWFRGGLAGYLRRQQVLASTSSSSTIQLDAPADIASDLAASVPANAKDLSATAPDSPEDTPLVTPRITPFTLRDSYLPTLAIPALALPKVPDLYGLTSSLPTRDLNFGFKDAVKQQWEDRRAVLDGMRLHLGGLGLRRRAGATKEDEVLAKGVAAANASGTAAEGTQVHVHEVTGYESE